MRPFSYKYVILGSNDWGHIDIAMALFIKHRFKVTTITCQDPVLLDFEVKYLKSVGVETPACTDMTEAEQDIPEGEIAFA
ncbi:hypothetical protein L596_030873 [Steinernema carpocapsae]|uniref:Uncharacterized protein n=1 Tax=Steinernema carpocapsae TaxID=34508 RepID=A0A4U5LNF1_STECR|nr:hypothetical protein L596_030873 [Steinernema carpocapsae]